MRLQNNRIAGEQDLSESLKASATRETEKPPRGTAR